MMIILTILKNIAIKEQTKKIAENILEQITRDKNLLENLEKNRELTLDALKEMTNNAKLRSLIEQIRDDKLLKALKIFLFENEKEKENELDNSMKILAETIVLGKEMIGQKINGTFFVKNDDGKKEKERKEREENIEKKMEKDVEFSNLIRKRKNINEPTI